MKEIWLDDEQLKIEARKRNLKISIVKGILDNGFELKSRYSRIEIIQYFYFRQRDLLYYSSEFFDMVKSKYILTKKMSHWVKEVIKRHDQAKGHLEDAQVLFEKTFGRFEDKCAAGKHYNFDFRTLNEMYQTQLQHIVQVIHWGRLPIIPEHLMVNSGRIPEKGIVDFYDHYHMLQQLRKDILGKGAVMNVKGDLTLDREMTFEVYTRRHGYTDTYCVLRTVEGWEAKHISINGKCDKDGTGALLQNLNHDSVFYPEDGVKYALAKLWDQAEEGEVTFEELQIRLQQIADWISTVEKAVGDGQPEWVGYY